VNELIRYLTRTAPGLLADTAALEELLAESWSQLDGSSASGMVGCKLLNRMEDVHWRPPCLSFAIERHIVRGTNRTVLEHWLVDLHCNTATVTTTEERILHPLSLRLSVEEAAEEIAQAILDGSKDDRIRWENDGTACVVASWMFPKDCLFVHTLGTRRRKLFKCVSAVLAEHGWRECGRNRFRRHAVPGRKRHFPRSIVHRGTSACGGDSPMIALDEG